MRMAVDLPTVGSGSSATVRPPLSHRLMWGFKFRTCFPRPPSLRPGTCHKVSSLNDFIVNFRSHYFIKTFSFNLPILIQDSIGSIFIKCNWNKHQGAYTSVPRHIQYFKVCVHLVNAPSENPRHCQHPRRLLRVTSWAITPLARNN